MKSLIVYKSIHHGNTEKIAMVLAEVLQAKLLSTREATPQIIGRYDLIGFGSGIYFGKHHHKLLSLVDDLPQIKDKQAFIFSTSGIRKLPIIHNFNKELRKKLLAKNYKIIGNFSCRGIDSYGPLKLIGGIQKKHPDQDDFDRATLFAENLIK
ncbi:flavodoxin family protein [Orenia marismortui]|uniref:Flavodoxin n=1 Tax=Orenia marismortui TaxID=46469 RepID=A0A4R8H1C0_9FIRM|nr:flavodoxin family protein [Orenia marismortui]TDX53317.1 flavodoxin [Orenia marismortui]